MYTRLELRVGRPAQTHRPGQWRREVHDHVRVLLIPGDGRKERLGTVEMPLTVEGRVEELVEKSEPKLRRLVPDDGLCKALLELLADQARAYRETPEQVEARLAREAAPFAKLRKVAAGNRAKEAAGVVPTKEEHDDDDEDHE